MPRSPFTAVAGALALATLLTITSCGGVGRIPRETAGAGTCRGGVTKPLSVQRVVSVLRANGFSVRSSTTSDNCKTFAPTLSGDEAPAFDVSSEGDVHETEGDLGCIVRKGPIWGATPQKDLDAPAASPIFSGRVAEFWFQNVDCRFYPSANEEAQVARFDRALQQLVRVQ